MSKTYEEFLKSKVRMAQKLGVDIEAGDINPRLKPHQKVIVQWAVQGGRRAIFAAFGLGKTIMQLETVRLTLQRSRGRGLIVCPLGVRQEFARDAAMLGTPIVFIRRLDEAEANERQLRLDGGEQAPPIYLTNYETVRDGKMDPRAFSVVSLDEAGVLRGSILPSRTVS